MVDLLAESIRTAALPCSLGLLLPGLVGVLLGSRHLLVAAFGAVAGSFIIAWARVSGLVDVPTVVAVAALVIGVVVMARDGERSDSVGAGAMLIGAFGASTWLPCVGPSFGQVLNEAPDAPLDAAPSVLLYIVGVMLVVVAVAVMPYAITRLREERAVTTQFWIGVAVASLLVGAVVIGVYDDVLDRLAQMSVNAEFTRPS